MPKAGDVVVRYTRIDADISSRFRQRGFAGRFPVRWKDVLQQPVGVGNGGGYVASTAAASSPSPTAGSPTGNRHHHQPHLSRDMHGNVCGVWRRAWPAEAGPGSKAADKQTANSGANASAGACARWNLVSQLRMRRRWLRRRTLRSPPLAALCVQTWWRRLGHAMHFRRSVRKCVAVPVIRRCVVRHIRKVRATRLQAACRCLLHRNRFHSLVHAAVVVQRSGVMTEVRRRTALRKSSAGVVQRSWRVSSSRRLAQDLRSKRCHLALQVQKHTRRFLSRRRLAERRDEVRAEEATREAERLRLFHVHQAWLGSWACRIQCATRMHQALSLIHI